MCSSPSVTQNYTSGARTRAAWPEGSLLSFASPLHGETAAADVFIPLAVAVEEVAYSYPRRNCRRTMTAGEMPRGRMTCT